MFRPLAARVRTVATFTLAAAVTAGLAICGPARAQNQPAGQPAAQEQPVQTMLVAERVGASEWLRSPKDKAIVDAVAMLPARLLELRQTVPDLQQVPEAVFALLPRLAAHPARIAITNKGFDQQTGMPGIGAVLSFLCPDEADARSFTAQFNTLRETAQLPFTPVDSTRFPGMSDLPLPMGVLSYGPRKSADGWRFEFIFAAIDDADAPFAALPAKPAGQNTLVRARADLAAWSPIVSMFAGFVAMGSPGGQNVMKELREAGILGTDAISLDLVATGGETESTWTLGVRKAAKFADAWGAVREPLTSAHFAIIPADASFVTIKRTNVVHQWNSIKQQIAAAGPGNEIAGFIEQFEQHTGVNLESDIIAALGDTVITYFSESTGGSSPLSGVVAVRIANPAKLAGALEKMTSTANAALRQNVPPPAAVEFARFTQGNVAFTQLRFPGLPVPVEPTLAAVGEWLIIGVTPQAATIGARYASGAPGAGLASNAAYKNGLWTLPGGAQPTFVTFVDNAHNLRDGYSSLMFMGSALANLARSSTTAATPREPGMIVPPLADLVAGARPSLMQTYWTGDDMIIESRGDSSVLVTLGGLFGAADAAPFIAGLVTGAGIGAGAASEASKSGAFEQMDDDEEEEADEPAEPQGEAQQPKRETPY